MRGKLVAEFLGDTHRPLSMLMVALGCLIALANDYGADKITAGLLGLGVLWGARSWENREQRRSEAEVAKAKVEAGGMQ